MSFPNQTKSLFGPVQHQAKPTPLPAPQKGVNVVDGLASMDPMEAIFIFNMKPSFYGVQVRTGYQMWAEDVDAGGIRSIIPFVGNSNANLFVAGEAGIYDVSLGGAGPWVPAVSFPTADDESGYGQWCNFTILGGQAICYCDETNGYYTYSGGVWAYPTLGGGAGQVTPIDPHTFVSVMAHKSRLWFVVKDSSVAYYLPVGQLTGTVTAFDFGTKFKHGGYLVNLFSWTVDGGEGVDDHLVAISSQGDIIVYKGDDPSVSASWNLRGQWYIGAVPAGRRLAGAFGGELNVLSQYGIIPLSKMISGQLIQQQNVYLSRKITPLISEQMAIVRNELGWEMKLVPHEQQLLVNVPKREGYPNLQFAQSTNNEAWSIFREIPLFTGDMWEGQFYFGNTDGNVYIYTGTQDNVSLDGTTSDSIEWSLLQTFQDLEEPGLFHIAQSIRPIFLSNEPPSYVAEMRFDYNLSESFGATSPAVLSGSLWDVALWDVGTWSGDFSIVDQLRGAGGIGRTTAVALSGQSNGRTILIRFDITTTHGWSM